MILRSAGSLLPKGTSRLQEKGSDLAIPTLGPPLTCEPDLASWFSSPEHHKALQISVFQSLKRSRAVNHNNPGAQQQQVWGSQSIKPTPAQKLILRHSVLHRTAPWVLRHCSLGARALSWKLDTQERALDPTETCVDGQQPVHDCLHQG